jgi:hypothetical protein
MPANDMYCTQCTSPICDFVLNPRVRVGDKTYEGALATHYAAETGEISLVQKSRICFRVFLRGSNIFTKKGLQYLKIFYVS